MWCGSSKKVSDPSQKASEFQAQIDHVMHNLPQQLNCLQSWPMGFPSMYSFMHSAAQVEPCSADTYVWPYCICGTSRLQIIDIKQSWIHISSKQPYPLRPAISWLLALNMSADFHLLSSQLQQMYFHCKAAEMLYVAFHALKPQNQIESNTHPPKTWTRDDHVQSLKFYIWYQCWHHTAPLRHSTDLPSLRGLNESNISKNDKIVDLVRTVLECQQITKGKVTMHILVSSIWSSPPQHATRGEACQHNWQAIWNSIFMQIRHGTQAAIDCDISFPCLEVYCKATTAYILRIFVWNSE